MTAKCVLKHLASVFCHLCIFGVLKMFKFVTYHLLLLVRISMPVGSMPFRTDTVTRLLPGLKLQMLVANKFYVRVRLCVCLCMRDCVLCPYRQLAGLALAIPLPHHLKRNRLIRCFLSKCVYTYSIFVYICPEKFYNFIKWKYSKCYI